MRLSRVAMHFLTREKGILILSLRENVFKMYEIHKKVLKLRTTSGHGWTDLCVRLPVVKLPGSLNEDDERAKREVDQSHQRTQRAKKKLNSLGYWTKEAPGAQFDSNQPHNGTEKAQRGKRDLFENEKVEWEEEADSDFAAIRAGEGLGVELDPSVVFYPERYCSIVEAMPMACFETRY